MPFGRERFLVQVAHGELDMQRSSAEVAESTLTSDVHTLGGLLFGDLTLAVAEAQGLIQIEGDREWAAHFAALFKMPEQVTVSGGWRVGSGVTRE